MSAPISTRTMPGFADPGRDAQQVFRSVLTAFSRPLLAQPLPADALPAAVPSPLRAEVAAVLLALCDDQTPLWLEPELSAAAELRGWLAFHTGARIVDDPAEAVFAVASPASAPRLADLAQGGDEDPHRSATLLIAVSEVVAPARLIASGPGIDGSLAWDGGGLPQGFLAEWRENGARFPRGVDVLLIGSDAVRGLPRTTLLSAAATADAESPADPAAGPGERAA